MSEPVKIVLTIEDGMIQQVMTAGVPIELIVVDYDVEDLNKDMLTTLDEDGPALLSKWHAERSDSEIPFIEAAFAAAEGL